LSVLSHLVAPAPARVLLGPESSGRSTLLRHLARRLSDNATTLRAPGPQTQAKGVQKSLLESAGLETGQLAIREMRSLLTVYIEEHLAKGRRVVIEIDDADRYNETAWKEIERVLAAGSGDRRPELLLSLVHLDEASSPAASYVRVLEAPALAVVDWLQPREVSSYLRWRLDRFGLAGVNTPSATRLVARCTRGCFAAIDHICQMALLLLRKSGEEQLSVNLVSRAMRRLRGEVEVEGGVAVKPRGARLIVSHDGKVIREAPLGYRTLIGRSHVNDICLDSAYLSRHHAVLVRARGGYYLTDLNSVNGVTVKGKRVEFAQIEDGEVFSIGPFRLKLQVPEELAADSAADPVPPRLVDTVVMPTPEQNPEPARLKVIK
jgi:hypothetical protein